MTQRRTARRRPFTFVDLFAGIGGMRLGFEAAGGRCVFTSEIDPKALETYRANHRVSHPLIGDIVGYPARAIPDHDVLVAGFPCQPFSLAGVSKRNSLGVPHGFACESEGGLFFQVRRVLRVKRPQAFLLENVKNLRTHDRGETFATITRELTRLGYRLHVAVVDGRDFVPQHRERLFIAGFRDSNDFSWSDLPLGARPNLRSILHPEDGSEALDPRYLDSEGHVLDKYTLTPALWRYLREYAQRHREAGNGFGYGLANLEGHSRTLSARYHKDGSEILVPRGPRRRPRRLTPRECARLMGFPDDFRIVVSDTQAYRQFGNSVVVPLIAEAARLISRSLPVRAGSSNPSAARSA